MVRPADEPRLGPRTTYEASSNASVFAAESSLQQFWDYARLVAAMTWASVEANMTARCALPAAR